MSVLLRQMSKMPGHRPPSTSSIARFTKRCRQPERHHQTSDDKDVISQNVENPASDAGRYEGARWRTHCDWLSYGGLSTTNALAQLFFSSRPSSYLS